MDRYIVREPRIGANYPQGNQVMAYPTNAGRKNIISDNVYYTGPCANQAPNMQHASASNYSADMQMNQTYYGQSMMSAQGQIVTGIDPRYLSNFSDNSAQYIVTGQPMQTEFNPIPVSPGPNFGANYQNNNFIGADRNTVKTFAPKVLTPVNNTMYLDAPKNETTIEAVQKLNFQHRSALTPQSPANVSQKTKDVDPIKKEPHNLIISRADKLKASQIVLMQNVLFSFIRESLHSTLNLQVLIANDLLQSPKRDVMILNDIQALHKSGPRAFSGPVEKVLKWHKALQDIGVFVFYEVVAKCVSVRPGESCAKVLVVRDDNGPAMQVVYYEIEYLLPEIKIPSTIRVVGRMVAGTCRLQAFNVRPATGDDVATLPRRAAVAAHHVARLCKEYGVHQ